MEKICRVCLEEKPWMIDIFTLDNTDTELPLFEKIIQCTNVPLAKNDSLPEHICVECKNDLNIAYRFRLNVEGSDYILKKFNLGLVNDETLQETVHIVEEVDMDDDATDLNDASQMYVETVSPKDPSPEKPVTNVRKSSENVETQVSPPKTMDIKTVMTFPKLSKEEKPPTIGIRREKNPDGSVKTLLRISRSTTTKSSKKTGGKHEANQASLHVCHECGKSFKKSSALRSHSKRHLSVKPNICEVCNKTFVLPVELKRHLRVHTGEKPYNCRYCDKKFSDFGTRVKHERIHTQEKPFECPFCLKTFTYANVLKFHIMVHTGEKKYVCEHCNKRFIKAHQLKCHLVTHGIGTPAKRKSRQASSKNHVVITPDDEIEAATASTNISTDIQTVQVMPTCDPTQTYMLYLKK